MLDTEQSVESVIYTVLAFINTNLCVKDIKQIEQMNIKLYTTINAMKEQNAIRKYTQI